MTQDRLERIAQIEALPELLAALVEDASESELDTTYREGGWTVRQVVNHLADSHMNAFVRMRLVLTEDHPILKPYRQDEWAALADSSGGSVGPSLAILRGLHARWAGMLRCLPDEVWERTGHHLEDGILSMDDLLVAYAEHCEKHLQHVRAGMRRSRPVQSA